MTDMERVLAAIGVNGGQLRAEFRGWREEMHAGSAVSAAEC
jgi:hypothetical protein